MANKEGIKLPAGVTKQVQQEIGKLDGAQGNQFDQQYVKLMINDHQKDISEYKQEMQANKQGPVGSYVAMTLPILEQHLALARDIQDEVQGGANTNQAAMTTNQNQTAANANTATK